MRIGKTEYWFGEIALSLLRYPEQTIFTNSKEAMKALKHRFPKAKIELAEIPKPTITFKDLL